MNKIEQAVDPVIAPVEADKPKAKAKMQAVKGNKVYVTTGKHTYPLDIQIHGEIISGQWSAGDGIVEFVVPDHLVAGFEKHHHFVTGNIVAA